MITTGAEKAKDEEVSPTELENEEGEEGEEEEGEEEMKKEGDEEEQEGEGAEEVKESEEEVETKEEVLGSRDDQLQTLPLNEMEVDSYWRIEEQERLMQEEIPATQPDESPVKEEKDAKIKKEEAKTFGEEERDIPLVEDLVSDEEKKDGESRGAFKDGIVDGERVVRITAITR